MSSRATPVQPIDEQLRRLSVVQAVGISLAAEHNREKLLEAILIEAKKLCHADGGTLYLYERAGTGDARDGDQLRFAIVRNDTLNLALGGTSGKPVAFPAVPMRTPDGQDNHRNVASFAACTKRTVAVADAYNDSDGFDFSGVKQFDDQNGYRSVSFLAIPLLGSRRQVIGVLQLINARDPETGEVRAFPGDDQDIVEALAAQAGVTLDNKLLLEGQRKLLESFIRLIAEAIDEKSPYTGGHCERVPVLTEMLARAACEVDNGPLAEFRLDDGQWYELRIAAWLHDCGKVVTPVHVMDKATKLEGIFDRIALIKHRFEVLEREAELGMLRAGRGDPEELEATRKQLRDDLAFIERVNLGGEFLREEDRERIARIGRTPYPTPASEETLLSDAEIENLSISRGTLTDAERYTINGHMVQTIQMLQALPFPKDLERVPEYATGHHERMDGTGYPRGIFAGDLSVPARIMAIADVFEALTAQDRPYKPGKTLSEAMRIMGFMKRDNHLDPDLFDLFVRSGVYREYARRYLPEALIDQVTEDDLLAIEPKAFSLPPAPERRARMASLLPEYESQRKRLGEDPPAPE